MQELFLTQPSGADQRYSADFVFSSLAAGAHNFDWTYRVAGGGSLSMWASPATGGNGWGPALMEAWGV